MVLLLKAKQMSLKCFYKYFHDSLNVVVILAHCNEFFFAECAQFPLTFKE